MESLFKIVPIEGKGVGWVALQEIKVGTLILSEKCQFEPKIQNDLWSLLESFFSMTTIEQKDFLKLTNLFWENPEYLECRKVDYGNWMAFANHYSSKNPEFDRELVLKIICIFESNKSLDDIWKAVAIKNSMINHSCCANAFSFKRNGSMEVLKNVIIVSQNYIIWLETKKYLKITFSTSWKDLSNVYLLEFKYLNKLNNTICSLIK